jgi:hypothetical protein
MHVEISSGGWARVQVTRTRRTTMDTDQCRGDILYIGPSAEVRRFVETLYVAGLNVRPGRASSTQIE